MKENTQQSIPDILFKFAHLLQTEVKGRRLEIPAEFGCGYCCGYVFNKHIRMLISNYELNEDLVIKNADIKADSRMLFFKFKNIFPDTETQSTVKQLIETPSVLIGTSRINTDDVISIHTNTATVNIEVDADYLNKLFEHSEKSPVLQRLLDNTQPLLFEQMVYPSLQKIVDEMVTKPVDEGFELFFMRIKAEELICRLLMELEKRDEKHFYPLNSYDIQVIYNIKQQMLKRIDNPPVIKELAIYAAMSPTKLKRLFKQIFGKSIFNYYQAFRMREAVRLLKEDRLSVSDTGYKLGFTNMSHFSRVFDQHIGIKPKKYSAM